MTDNDSNSGEQPESTGNPKGQRRRGRRRSRRRGQSTQPGATPTPTPQENTSTGPDKSDGETPQRQRRRRSSRGGKNRPQQQADSTEKSASDNNRPTRGGQNRRGAAKNGNKNRRGQSTNRQRQGPAQHNRNTSASRHRGPDTSRMVTRDETSAGGLVMSGLAEAVDSEGNVDFSRIYVALIGRLDRRGRLLWSMPKGHVEPGEGHAATAEREVWEETGISGTVIIELGVIDYWFVSDGVRIHKTVHHHLLRFADGNLNDEDPEVTEVAWIPASELIEHLAYADERKLARIAHDRLPDLARKEKAEGRATPR